MLVAGRNGLVTFAGTITCMQYTCNSTSNNYLVVAHVESIGHQQLVVSTIMAAGTGSFSSCRLTTVQESKHGA